MVICVCYDCSVLPGQESEWSYVCARIAVFYRARRVSGHTCVRIAVFYQARRVSGHICVRIAVFYQARRVSGHMCVLGLQCFTRSGK